MEQVDSDARPPLRTHSLRLHCLPDPLGLYSSPGTGLTPFRMGENTALEGEPRKTVLSHSPSGDTLLWTPPSPPLSNQAAVENILLLFNSPPPSCLSSLSFIISEHPRGSRLSLIYFHPTPIESLQERAQRPKMQKDMGDTVS